MSNKYGWEQYLTIENDFIQARRFISFERQSNLDADSPFLHNAIVLLGSNVETAMKKLIKIGTGKEDLNISTIADYKCLLMVMVPDIEKYYVSFVGTDATPLKPFVGWSTSQLGWWSAYTAIKHGSTSRLPKLEHGLNLLAAYLIVLHLIHVLEAKNRNTYSVVYGLSELPKLFYLGFKGCWNLDDERPFQFGYEVSKYNICNNTNEVKKAIREIQDKKDKA